MERSPAGSVGWSLAIVAAIAATLLAAELVRPVVAGPVGFDSAASVIHFERIVAGRTLEAFVTATPKPFLTLVYGGLYALTADWRVLSWATILAFAVSVPLAGWLAWRVAGPLAAIVTAIALAGSRVLLGDVIIGYAVPWALLFWLIAGLAVTGQRPRPALAGMALLIGSLARLETLVVVGVAALVLAFVAVGRLVRREPVTTDRLWWPVVLGFGALPVMLVHDWLMTGDPFFWISVSARYSAADPDSVRTPLEIAVFLLERYLRMPLLVVFAGLGALVMARSRQWPPLVGLLGLGPGIALFLLLLAARGTYVSNRYVAPIDLALVLVSGVGFAAAWILLERRVGSRGRRARADGAGQPVGIARRALPVVVAVAVGIAIGWPPTLLDGGLRSSARSARLQAEHADRVLPVLDCALDAVPGSRELPPPGTPMGGAPEEVVLLVAGLLRPRLAVDLAVPLTKVGGTPVTWVDPAGDFLPHGRIVFHDRLGNRPAESFASLEVGAPTETGDVTLVPLLVEPEDGIWVQWVQWGVDRSAPSCPGPGDG